MKKIAYILYSVLMGVACSSINPEKDYQTCITAEEAYNSFSEKFDQESKTRILTTEEIINYEKESDKLFENAKEVFASFFKKHINSAFAQNIFSESRWTRRLNSNQLELIINAVTDNAFKETEAFKNASDRILRMKVSLPGNLFTNIISKDQEGNTIELANYVGKGKYVLLDFWASWCPDCQKEMPELIELYEAYKDKNFEIVGYSLDRNKEAWVKGIETLKINWQQMSDCDFWNSQGAKLYAVQFIPLNILFNPEGIIIERGKNINSLKEILAKLIK